MNQGGLSSVDKRDATNRPSTRLFLPFQSRKVAFFLSCFGEPRHVHAIRGVEGLVLRSDAVLYTLGGHCFRRLVGDTFFSVRGFIETQETHQPKIKKTIRVFFPRVIFPHLSRS